MSLPCLNKVILSYPTCSLPGEKARPHCSKANATASNKTFVESTLARNAHHYLEIALQAESGSTSKYGFSPDLEGKNGGVLSMRMQVILDFSFRPLGFSPYMGAGT